jgi:heme/copper-type cytochrome/quinol oxidase subunit 2
VSTYANTSAATRRVFVHALLGLLGTAATARAAAQTRRDFTVVARNYSFTVVGSDTPEVRVMQNDLVQITFSTEDIPHSFAIEEAPYRIMRRAEPGKPVTFSFRADEPGRFRFYCSLTADPRCREMLGALVVSPNR